MRTLELVVLLPHLDIEGVDLCTASRLPQTIVDLLVILCHSKDHQLLLHGQCAIPSSTDPWLPAPYPQNQTRRPGPTRTSVRTADRYCHHKATFMVLTQNVQVQPPWPEFYWSSRGANPILRVAPRDSFPTEKLFEFLQLHTNYLTANHRPQNVSRTQILVLRYTT